MIGDGSTLQNSEDSKDVDNSTSEGGKYLTKILLLSFLNCYFNMLIPLFKSRS